MSKYIWDELAKALLEYEKYVEKVVRRNRH